MLKLGNQFPLYMQLHQVLKHNFKMYELHHSQQPVVVTDDEFQAHKNEDNVVSMINLFHNNIKYGPEYICTCCDQIVVQVLGSKM